jgi:hypothetical protein
MQQNCKKCNKGNLLYEAKILNCDDKVASGCKKVVRYLTLEEVTKGKFAKSPKTDYEQPDINQCKLPNTTDVCSYKENETEKTATISSCSECSSGYVAKEEIVETLYCGTYKVKSCYPKKSTIKILREKEEKERASALQI